MANIFKEQKAVNEHPNRNNFDLSKKSNLSMKFGTLYPVYCQPVVPGDSFSIDTAFNLKLMPVVFPVQTKMRAHMHYFYVRNKNLWSNWENWISNLVTNTEHPHPYISLSDSDFKNGSIHDFLGVPTSVISNTFIPSFSPLSYDRFDTGEKFVKVGYGFYSASDITSLTLQDWPLSTSFGSGHPYAFFVFNGCLKDSYIYEGEYLNAIAKSVPDNVLYEGFTIKIKNLGSIVNTCGVGSDKPIVIAIVSQKFTYDELDDYYKATTNKVVVAKTTNVSLAGRESDDVTIADLFTADELAAVRADDGYHYICVGVPFSSLNVGFDISSEYTYTPQSTLPVVAYSLPSLDNVDYSTLGLDLYSNNLHINALPYRAYESVFYTYYNNNVLNPLKVNNQIQYNRYNTNLGDGADSTPYHLFQRNYELDFLTSALPSPQQGVAPVVGMTALGDITIEDENGITTAHATIDDDGTISKVVLTSPAASNEHARTAMNIASCGMSISDFRQTNALQRFLETNIRKGYRYMDFIAGHFGKEPEYRELDLPEFIGGFSRDVQVSTVVSNADTLGADSGAALGEYGGYAQVVGGSKHSVRHYCDDYGFIIGILSVVPTPCYSQLLPKHMVAPDNFLDYYFPEFSSSGLQPITYKEVCPIQSYIDSQFDSDKSLGDTFGYQRPNYDMVSAVDELHGEFRGSLKDYVINRQFDTRPELGQSFIGINPSEVNDIFVDTNPDDDTIIGEIGFAVHAKRPVPRVVIPNLGK